MKRNFSRVTCFFVFLLSLTSGTTDKPAIYKSPKVPIEERVNDLLSRMTLAEKIGQMAQINHTNVNPLSDLAEYGIGSILSGGDAMTGDISAAAWADLYDEMQKYALKSRLQIPIIYGIDAVHGHGKVRGATVFPHNIGLGATHDPVLIEKIGQITAIEVAGTGIDWTFSPCVAVPQDPRWGRYYEGFSENPELVATLGAAMIRGYQEENLTGSTSILATAKHFLGDGGTKYGLDQGDTVLPESGLKKLHLLPYTSAISNNVGAIMASYNSWNGEKVHGIKYLLTDLLRNQLGFKGILVSDWEGIKQLPGNASDQIQKGINAGIDMVMIPDDYSGFIEKTRSLVNEGKISKERIDEAVKRILTIKFSLGLFEHPFTDRSLTASVGSIEHREVARQAVRESLVLLKNKNKLLPLKKDLKTITVVGIKADDIGSQCGGWTIHWQGSTGNITEGTSILQAIQHTVSPDTTVVFSPEADDLKKSDVIVAVVGEDPYAEMKGDRMDLELSADDKANLQKVFAQKTPVVIVLLSGRPLIITDEIKKCQAFMAAWLPGTEGQGIADVLFGDYKPTGKLPCTWPRNMSQVPINMHNGKRNPLFPYGYGLTY